MSIYGKTDWKLLGDERLEMRTYEASINLSALISNP
jgi:hypothetical protein